MTELDAIRARLHEKLAIARTNWEEWKQDRPEQAAWMLAQSAANRFVWWCRFTIEKTGDLTGKQEGVMRAYMARNDNRIVKDTA